MSKVPPNNGVWAPRRKQDIPKETMAVIQAVVDKVPDLPPAGHKIIEMTADTDTHLDDLVNEVSSDPILVSKILKEVNSTYYGLHRKTDNLQLAVVMLGFKEVRRIAITNCVNRTLGDGNFMEGYESQDFWEHSYLVSVCAGTFSDENEPQSLGKLLTFGLLHDIGKFVLYAVAVLLKKRDNTVSESQVKPSTPYLLEKEEFFFGANHAIIGGLLAEKWNLSDRLTAVIESHHLPSFYGISDIPALYQRDIAAVCIADMIVNSLYGKSHRLPEPHPVFFELLGKTTPLSALITDEIRDRLDQARTFFNNS